MTAPTVEEQLTMLAIVRSFVEYDGDATMRLWPDAYDDIEQLAIGLASFAAVLVTQLAAARGITPGAVIDEQIHTAIETSTGA